MPTDAHGIPKDQSTTDKLRKSIAQIMKRPGVLRGKNLPVLVTDGPVGSRFRSIALKQSTFDHLNLGPFVSISISYPLSDFMLDVSAGILRQPIITSDSDTLVSPVILLRLLASDHVI